jgi:hypothetical protein
MTRSAVVSLSLLSICLASRLASAQSPTPLAPITPSPAPLDAEIRSPPPRPPEIPFSPHGHAGLVFGISVGYSAPAGNTTSAAGDNLAATFGYQIPLSVDLGVNILPSLFLGAYGTFADGGPGSTLGAMCAQYNCAESSFRGGLVIEYRLLPGRTFEPWIGYGAGYDVSAVTLGSVNQFGTAFQHSANKWRGWDVAHIRAGLDFLTDPYSAAGVFIDVGIGQFSNEWSQAGSLPGVDVTITNPTLHQWWTFGARWTFMP